MTGRRQPTTVGTRTRADSNTRTGLSMPKRCASDCTRANDRRVNRSSRSLQSLDAGTARRSAEPTAESTPASQTMTAEGSRRSSGTGGTTLTEAAAVETTVTESDARSVSTATMGTISIEREAETRHRVAHRRSRSGENAKSEARSRYRSQCPARRNESAPIRLIERAAYRAADQSRLFSSCSFNRRRISRSSSAEAGFAARACITS